MTDLIFGDFGIEIIKFVQSIGGESLDLLFQGFTILGNTISYIVIILIIYWIIDKKSAVKLLWITIITGFTVGAIKGFVGLRRPFQVLDTETSDIRLNWKASGYSFPSGHASGSTSFFSMIAAIVRKNWFSIICVVMFLIIGLSRIRLAVHWPTDVMIGFFIGGFMFGVFYYYHEPVYQYFLQYNKKQQLAIICCLSVTLLAISTSLTVLMGHDLIIGSVGDVTGIFLGSAIGLVLERDIDFQPPKTKIKAFLRIFVGISATILAYYGGKILIEEIHHILDQALLFPVLEFILYSILSLTFVYLVPRAYITLDW